MKSLLSEVSIFQNISGLDCSSLEKKIEVKKFKKGDVLFNQGDPANRLFVINKGFVKLFRCRQGSQKEEIVCLVRPQEYCCLAPVLTRPLFHLGAKAIVDTEAVIIPKQSLISLLNRSHVFAKNIVIALAGKECDLCEEVCDLSLQTSKERLAKYLLEQTSKERKTFSLNLTQSQLAAHLGTVRETLSRDFSALKKAKLIRLHKGLISILNEAELIRLGGRKNECSFPSTQAVKL